MHIGVNTYTHILIYAYTLLDIDEKVASLEFLTRVDVYFLDEAGGWSRHSHLHLHGWQDYKMVALLDSISFFYTYVYYLSCNWMKHVWITVSSINMSKISTKRWPYALSWLLCKMQYCNTLWSLCNMQYELA